MKLPTPLIWNWTHVTNGLKRMIIFFGNTPFHYYDKCMCKVCVTFCSLPIMVSPHRCQLTNGMVNF